MLNKDDLKDIKSTRGQGFGGAKPNVSSTPKKGSELMLNPMDAASDNLNHSLAAQVNEFSNIAQAYGGSVQLAAGHISDFLCDAYSGKLLAQEVMSQTAQKLQQVAPISNNSTAAFQPPEMASSQAIEEFYTKTSFLRETHQKQITGK